MIIIEGGDIIRDRCQNLIKGSRRRIAPQRREMIKEDSVNLTLISNKITL